MNDPNKKSGQGDRGFTLLLAALVASIVLAIGASIFSISLKEVTLSSIGRDSQFAFYAADSGAECALYWDDRFRLFSSTPETITCDQDTVPVNSSGVSDTSGTYTFEYQTGGRCVDDTVTKYLDTDGKTQRTTIRANGYNVDCLSIGADQRVLQRSVELHY